ncbi:hypothetical protein GCM10022243_20960 [Saccharothrix violaceirubra]|uniref:DivIVA domain-containing protein n=1 Tax=Saccharothrix violaceirubra TaxID=413306 RepID=A0A7W7T8J3_9PSEU|nr:DivIVA domain-containing protein [Saccharothrix violaceirubra]MBB4968563.1 DivIVA domain-containing protein [Saccharothrix violaceirubra]
MPFPYLTPARIRSLRFSRRRNGKGYDPAQVDAAVIRIADGLAGLVRLEPDEVRNLRFHEVPGGYDQRPVDEFLGQVEWQLRAGVVPPTRLRSGQDLLDVRLPRASGGYDRGEVDAFLARAATSLDGRGRMTAVEVRHTRFSTTTGLRRGYRVQAVDALLDDLEQEFRFRGR